MTHEHARLVGLALVVASIAPSMVSAQHETLAVERYRSTEYFELEITTLVGLVDRTTAGTRGAPSGYGYENDAGLGLGGEVRLYHRQSSFFRHGVIVGSMQQAGPALGYGGVAFHSVFVDVGYTASVMFPCMSDDELRWQLSGILALTGMYADAGTGVGGTSNGPDLDARNRAADLLDHYGLGWRLAFDLSWHIREFIVGIGLGGRQAFAIDSPVARVWTMDLHLRIGARFDIGR